MRLAIWLLLVRMKSILLLWWLLHYLVRDRCSGKAKNRLDRAPDCSAKKIEHCKKIWILCYDIDLKIQGSSFGTQFAFEVGLQSIHEFHSLKVLVSLDTAKVLTLPHKDLTHCHRHRLQGPWSFGQLQQS